MALSLTEIIKLGTMGVKANDAITLVKNGYTAENIQELLKDESANGADDLTDNASGSTDEESAGSKEEKNDSEPEQKKEEKAPAEHETSDKDKEIEKLKAELEKAQAENTRKDMQSHDEKKTQEEKLLDIICDFM